MNETFLLFWRINVMKKIKLTIAIILVILGCIPKPSPQELANATFASLPSNYENKIKDAFTFKLIDPTAPVYKFQQPVKKTKFKGVLRGGGHYYGWQVCGLVNSKNRFGGYVGWKKFSAFFYGPDQPVIESGMSAESNGC